MLTVELDAIGVPWRYDTPAERFPHIYGPIPRSAIRRVVPIPRDEDGRFGAFPP